MPAVSGGSHEAVPYDPETRDEHHGQEHVPGLHDHPSDPHEHDEPDMPDATRIELATLLPLAVLTIIFGVYPKPIFDIVEPTFERILLPFLS
jgi:hypothetical protein